MLLYEACYFKHVPLILLFIAILSLATICRRRNNVGAVYGVALQPASGIGIVNIASYMAISAQLSNCLPVE